MNEVNDKRGPYVKKEDVAFWFPVSKKLDEMIQTVRQSYRRKGKKPPAPFQLINEAIEYFAESNKY